MLEILKESIRINSPSGHEIEIGTYYTTILKKNGFDVELQLVDKTGRFNILASKECDNKTPAILFYGHMDTVTPPIDKDNPDKISPKYIKDWEIPFFEPTEVGGKLYGLGACDMKGGIAAFIEATKNTKSNVKILLGVNEETDSDGAWKIYHERQNFFKNVGLIISAEPSIGLVQNQIITGRTGRVLYNANFIGKTEHVMRASQAVDAIEKLARYANKLYSDREKQGFFKSPMSFAQISNISSYRTGMNVVGRADATIEVFPGPEDSKETVLQTLSAMTEDDKDVIAIAPRKTEYLTGYTFEDFPGKSLLANIVKSHTGMDAQFVFRTSVADDNIFALLRIPVITWGPQGENEHNPKECVDLKSLTTLVQMYKNFLNNLNENG